jgi:hypothetical protein
LSSCNQSWKDVGAAEIGARPSRRGHPKTA